MGRKPNVIVDNEVSHFTKETLKDREEYTPIYESQKFEPPKTLSKAELEVWHYLVKIFRDTRGCMVSDADLHLMEFYCRDKVAYEDAKKRYNGQYYINVQSGYDKDGNVKYQLKTNPDYAIMKDCSAACLKWFEQLGLSPLARAKVGVAAANAKKKQNVFESILNRSDD